MDESSIKGLSREGSWCRRGRAWYDGNGRARKELKKSCNTRERPGLPAQRGAPSVFNLEPLAQE